MHSPDLTYTFSNGADSPNSEATAPVGGADAVSHPVRGQVLERWPTLSRALDGYEYGMADQFSKMAYDMVEAGIIRLEERQRLAGAAEDLGIRAFDAQLLIACAIRRWGMDHTFDASPSRDAPALSPEYKAWSRMWVRLGLIACTASILEAIILWKWLS